MTYDLDRVGRLSFMKIDVQTTELLSEFRGVLAENIENILDAFYSHAATVPVLAAKFDSPQHMARARNAQKVHWLDGVFSGRFDDNYFASATRIGQTHERIELEPRWYLAGYQLAMSAIHKLVVKKYKGNPDKAGSVIEAVNKAIMLDMDLAISIYIQTAKDNAEKQLNDHANDFEGTVKAMVESLAAASTELSATAQTLTASATDGQERSAEVAINAEKASENVQTVAAATEQLSASVNEISTQVAETSAKSQQMVAVAADTSAQIQELSTAAQEVGDVVQMINQIAGQTNLLALNATIEAARAGESGKGFAVVASEVKSLAGQTAKATEQISKQISNIQSATENSVKAISNISEAINDLNAIAGNIASAVEEQDAATKEIARNVGEAATGTDDISTKMAGVSESAKSTGASASEVLTAANDVSKQSELLSMEVDQFLSKIRTA